MRLSFAAALGAVLLAGIAPAQEAPRGKRIFTQQAAPPCALCHTLADAGAEGEIGPNLDQLKPSADRVRAAVEGGLGAMPAYGGSLSAAQIEAVARYVAEAAGG